MHPHLQHTPSILDLIEKDSKKLKFGLAAKAT
jgi:hypothetical protein